VWRVPYDAVDAAGNRARTVFRTVRVREFSLDEHAAHAIKRRELELRREILMETQQQQQQRRRGGAKDACPPCALPQMLPPPPADCGAEVAAALAAAGLRDC
jgi:hypothetical protein